MFDLQFYLLTVCQLVQVLKEFVRNVQEKSQQGAMQVCTVTAVFPLLHRHHRRQVLIACDSLRDDVLPPLGIRLEDQQVPRGSFHNAAM